MEIPRARRRSVAWRVAVIGGTVATALLMTLPGAVTAASPVGTVRVAVVDDETHEPLGGVVVELTAFVSSAADPVFTASLSAGDDGTVTFDDVPRAVGADAVSVTAEATLIDTMTVDGCTIAERWSGASESVAVAADTAVEVAASREQTATCMPPGPDAPVLHGIILAPDGRPLVPRVATVSMQRADGGAWDGAITVADNGSFAVRVEPWGTADEPADLVVRVTGATTGSETEGDCTYELAPAGSVVRRVELAGGDDPAPVTVVTDIARVSGVCGTTGSPTPTKAPDPSPSSSPTASPTPKATPAASHAGAGPTPRATLPATDALAGPDSADDGRLAATLVALMLGGLAAALSVAARRTDRRR